LIIVHLIRRRTVTFSTIPDTSFVNNVDLHQAPSRNGAMPQAPAAQRPPTPPIASGAKAKARAILAAIRTLQAIEQAQRPATPEERQVLARFPGFGPVALGIFLFSYLQSVAQTIASERVARDLRTRLVAVGTPAALRDSAFRPRVRVTLRDGAAAHADRLRLAGLRDIIVDRSVLSIALEGPWTTPGLVTRLVAGNLDPKCLIRHRPSLCPLGSAALLFRPIQRIRLATAEQCSHQKSCHTGEGRCPSQNWVPAFAGKTRKKASR